MNNITVSKPNILRPELEIRGWLENTIRSYLRTTNNAVRGELRAEGIMLIWVLDRDLTWFAARDLFDDKAADIAANEPEEVELDA